MDTITTISFSLSRDGSSSMLHLEQHICLPSIGEVLLKHPSRKLDRDVSGKVELAPLRHYIITSPASSPPQPIHPSSLSSLNYDYNGLPSSMSNLGISPSPAAAADHDHQEYFYQHRRSRSENISLLHENDPLRINYRHSPPITVFSLMSTLKRSASQPQRRYTCHYCQKGFIRPSSLRTHTYSHTGQKPFACTFEGCHKRFSVLSNMRRHMRRHRNPTTPGVCGTSFSISSASAATAK